jgi:hypothetical protein
LALIGFVFPSPPSAKIAINTCYHWPYAHFYPRQIGFVFSNSSPSSPPVSDFEFRVSSFRPKAGELALFFQVPFAIRITRYAVRNKLALFFKIVPRIARIYPLRQSPGPLMLDWLGPDYATREELLLRGYDLPCDPSILGHRD